MYRSLSCQKSMTELELALETLLQLASRFRHLEKVAKFQLAGRAGGRESRSLELHREHCMVRSPVL